MIGNTFPPSSELVVYDGYHTIWEVIANVNAQELATTMTTTVVNIKKKLTYLADSMLSLLKVTHAGASGSLRAKS